MSDPHCLCALAERLFRKLLCCNPWVECSTEGQKVFWNVDFSAPTVQPHSDYCISFWKVKNFSLFFFLPPFYEKILEPMICVGALSLSWYAKALFWCSDWQSNICVPCQWHENVGIVAVFLGDHKFSQSLFMVRERDHRGPGGPVSWPYHLVGRGSQGSLGAMHLALLSGF